MEDLGQRMEKKKLELCNLEGLHRIGINSKVLPVPAEYIALAIVFPEERKNVSLGYTLSVRGR